MRSALVQWTFSVIFVLGRFGCNGSQLSSSGTTRTVAVHPSTPIQISVSPSLNKTSLLRSIALSNTSRLWPDTTAELSSNPPSLTSTLTTHSVTPPTVTPPTVTPPIVTPPTVTPPTVISTVTPPPPTPHQEKGFCARYTEQPCQDVLNRSLLQYNASERYFDTKHGINGSKEFLMVLLPKTSQLKDKRCRFLIEASLCQYTLPPCLGNGRPITFCREDCESLKHECNDPVQRLLGSAEVLTKLQKLDFSHLELPSNCSVFSSGKAKDSSCVYIGLFDHSSKSSTPLLSEKILWIIIGAASFLVIILSTAITVCCVKRRRRKKKEMEEFEAVTLRQFNTDSTSTMKARLSQLLSVSSKIAELYDPSKLKQFSLDQIEYISDLGEGQFGLVFKGAALGIDHRKDVTERSVVAVKTLKTDCNDDNKEEFYQEVALMSVLDHPNVVKLMAVATEEEPLCMIFEFMEFGDLNQFLRRIRPLDDAEEAPEMELCLEDFLSICQQVASGMLYLASLHFVHRDLATRNCLVGEGVVVKIADFGLARDIYSSDYYKVRGDAMLPVRWMPPEAVLHGRFTVESDVFSYGVLIWEVFTYALQPYYGYSNEEVIGFAKKGVLLGQPEECPDHIYKLMLDCWIRTPEKRPDFTSIIKRLVNEPPAVSNYCVPRSLSITVEDPIDGLHVSAEEPIAKCYASAREPMGRQSAASQEPIEGCGSVEEPMERRSVVSGEPIERLSVAAQEPIERRSVKDEMERLSFPRSGKAGNHYMSPGAIVNSGFKSDKAECSSGRESSSVVGSYDDGALALS